MSKVLIGNCVYYDSEMQSEILLPLLECLSYVIDGWGPLDYFLKTILRDESEGGPGGAGSDPGWSIHWIPDAEEALFPEDWRKCMAQLPSLETGCYEAWTNQDYSDLDPPCGYYSKDIVRYHIRDVLENFRHRFPERSREVDDVVKRFKLENALIQDEKPKK